MARVDIDDAEATEAVETDATEVSENINTEVSEATEAVEATDAVSTEAAAEQEAPEKTGPSEEEIKALVDAFTEEVEKVVNDAEGGRDASTGSLSVELVQRVKAKFSALPAGGTRKSCKDYLNDKMRSCMDDAMSAGGDMALFSKARSYLQLHEEATTAAKSAAQTVAKPQLSPTEALIERALSVYMAPWAIEVPSEGVDADWQDKLQAKAAELQPQVATYYAYLAEMANLPEDAENKPAEPEVDPHVKGAFRLARGRAVGSGAKRAAGTKGAGTPRPAGSPRGDVGRHILNAFADKAPGTFLTVAEIVNTPSQDCGYAPGDKPSPGAVAARLFKDGQPYTTLAGIEPGYENQSDPNSKKGARKA